MSAARWLQAQKLIDKRSRKEDTRSKPNAQFFLKPTLIENNSNFYFSYFKLQNKTKQEA